MVGGSLRGIVEEMRLENSEWKQLSCVFYASTCSVIGLGLQVASATGNTEDDDGKDDEPKLEEEGGDIDEDAGEDEDEVYESVHNYNDVELPTFGAAEEEDYYGEY